MAQDITTNIQRISVDKKMQYLHKICVGMFSLCTNHPMTSEDIYLPLMPLQTFLLSKQNIYFFKSLSSNSVIPLSGLYLDAAVTQQ